MSDEHIAEKASQSEENIENIDAKVNKDLDQELQTEKEKYIRLFAEFDNYKKRTSRERIETIKRANQELMVALIPVLDDFERGIKELEKNEATEHLVGIRLIHQKFQETLIAKGLKKMEVEAGDDFDTDKHEAITQIPAPSEELKEKIIDVTETGYLLNGTPIRFAKVVVGQ